MFGTLDPGFSWVFLTFRREPTCYSRFAGLAVALAPDWIWGLRPRARAGFVGYDKWPRACRPQTYNWPVRQKIRCGTKTPSSTRPTSARSSIATRTASVTSPD
ncbi:hypothetical protein SBV1_250016 [Verrucomicrobia bacterium]|nr:hypothetical protein SBV1_250016 [Verrucomicrobiota bacterium]